MFKFERLLPAVIYCIMLGGLPQITPHAAGQGINQTEVNVNEVGLRIDNSGRLGINVQNLRPAARWPLSANTPGHYMLGGGIWFGARKQVEGQAEMSKAVFKTYDPNSATSWATPGDWADGPNFLPANDFVAKYHVYSSSDFDAKGIRQNFDGPAWPLWNPGWSPIGPAYGNFGMYIGDVAERNSLSETGPPVYIADQDVVTRYKDGDTDYYAPNPDPSLPFGLQIEQAAYAWTDFGLENFVILRYDFTNVSNQTLYDCHAGFVCDYDIGNPDDPRLSSSNDMMASYPQFATRQMAAMWSAPEADVAAGGYGYMGVGLLQSPMIDEDGFVLDVPESGRQQDQVGLGTVRDWRLVVNDPRTPADEYDFMSTGTQESSSTPDDGRLMFATNAFNLAPGKSARVVFVIAFARANGQNPNGASSDIGLLTDEIDLATETWYDVAVSVDKRPQAATPALALAPNPATNMLTITVNSPAEAFRSQIEIYDMRGAIVKTQIVNSLQPGQNKLTLNLADLTPGTYIAQLRVAGQNLQSVFQVAR